MNAVVKSARAIAVVITMLLLSSTAAFAGSGYDVAGIYEKIPTPYGTKAISNMSEVVEIESVLVPKELELGSYKISVTRRGSNLYEVAGYGIYIVTRYCYEYGYGEEAILECTSNSGFSRGTLTFID